MKKTSFLLVFLLCGIFHCAALDVLVTQSPASGGAYRTIGEAFAAVAKAGGGTVIVDDDGTYAESIPTGTAAWSITVRAASGHSPVLQIGTFSDNFFYLQGSGQNLTLDGFHTHSVIDSKNRDGKLVVTEAAGQVVTVRNCLLTGVVNHYLIRLAGTRPTLNLSQCRFFLSYEIKTYVESAVVGMVVDNATLNIDQSTYVQNPVGGSPSYYGVIWCDRNNPTISLTNSIFYDHSTNPQAVIHIWSAVADKGRVNFENCSYPEGYAAASFNLTPRNSQTIEPGLLDPAGGDFRLNANSPCINAGYGRGLVRNIGWDQETQYSAAVARVRRARSITYYPFPTGWGGMYMSELTKAFDGMKAIKGNTIWFVLPWNTFQPKALPTPTWNESAIKQLEQALVIADQKGFNVILPLCYLGEGWSPQGIDPFTWTIDPTMHGAFKTYVKTLVARLAAKHKNLMFLLYTESGEPYSNKLRDIPLYKTSFTTYCKSVNPDVNYWNNRWGTSFTWDTFQPAPFSYCGGLWQVDHWRWVANIMRTSHGELARELHDVLGENLVGFHDYTFDQGLVDGDNTPIPTDNPYDFLSVAHYYNGWQAPSTATFEQELNSAIVKYANRFPTVPLIFGETGACDSQVGRDLQGQVVKTAASVTSAARVGVNFWMWKDFTVGDVCQQSFGMLDANGVGKPSYNELRAVWLSTRYAGCGQWNLYR